MAQESLPLIRIGTRASKLALAQAEMVQHALSVCHPHTRFELAPMLTTGDRVTDRALAEIGGKGLFAKELDEALLRGNIHLCVHSAKDMESIIHSEIEFVAALPREDNRDVFISASGTAFHHLPQGAVLGTASVRRAAQALMQRPDLRICILRGNVPTRIEKIRRAEADGTFLALAGLKRLGLEAQATEILDRVHFLPAACQGIIGLTCRKDDEATRRLLTPLNHSETFAAATAERAVLAALDGSCRTPIAAWARVEEDRLKLSAALYALDGREHYSVERTGSITDADALGQSAGEELLSLGRHLLP